MNPRLLLGSVAVVFLAGCGTELETDDPAPEVSTQRSELVQGCQLQTGVLTGFAYVQPGNSMACPTWVFQNTEVQLRNNSAYGVYVVLQSGVDANYVWVGAGNTLRLWRYYAGRSLILTPYPDASAPNPGVSVAVR